MFAGGVWGEQEELAWLFLSSIVGSIPGCVERRARGPRGGGGRQQEAWEPVIRNQSAVPKGPAWEVGTPFTYPESQWAGAEHGCVDSLRPRPGIFSPAQDAHRRHPLRRGLQPWHEAPPSSLAPGPAAQEVTRPAGGPSPPRCGVPDPPDGPSAHNRQKRFVLSGGRWEKTELTYR